MKEEILKLVKLNNGIITTSQVEKAGFLRVYLKTLVDDGLLVREKQGVYADPGIINDKFYIFQVKHPNAIFSYETALYLQGIDSDKTEMIDVTVYTGYNTHRFPKNIRSHYIKKELLDYDVIEVKTEYGNVVKCYNAARAICDIVKTEYKDDEYENVTKALNNYFRSDLYNEKSLISCANKLNCYKKLNYTIGVNYLANKFTIN